MYIIIIKTNLSKGISIMSYTIDTPNAFNPEIVFVCENTYPAALMPYVECASHHHTCVQLSIILSGELDYTINDETYRLHKGHVVLIDSHVKHSVTIPKDTKCSDIHIGLNLDGIFDIFPDTPFFEVTLNHEDFLNCALQIAYEHRHHKSCYPLMLKALIMRLLVLIQRETLEDTLHHDFSSDNFTSTEKKEVIDFITRYITNHYMNDITLDLFSKNMYLSQAYISKIFKEETGISPIKFLIQTRLSKAKNLLENEKLPIKVVAKQVGYDDVYHFSKLFKKYYGMPPSTLIKKTS